jgi:hypothetical protein
VTESARIGGYYGQAKFLGFLARECWPRCTPDVITWLKSGAPSLNL